MELDNSIWLKILRFAIDEDWNNYIVLRQVNRNISILTQGLTCSYPTLSSTECNDLELSKMDSCPSQDNHFYTPATFSKWRPFSYPVIPGPEWVGRNREDFYFKRCFSLLDLSKDNTYAKLFPCESRYVECLESIEFISKPVSVTMHCNDLSFELHPNSAGVIWLGMFPFRLTLSSLKFYTKETCYVRLVYHRSFWGGAIAWDLFAQPPCLSIQVGDKQVLLYQGQTLPVQGEQTPHSWIDLLMNRINPIWAQT